MKTWLNYWWLEQKSSLLPMMGLSTVLPLLFILAEPEHMTNIFRKVYIPILIIFYITFTSTLIGLYYKSENFSIAPRLDYSFRACIVSCVLLSLALALMPAIILAPTQIGFATLYWGCASCLIAASFVNPAIIPSNTITIPVILIIAFGYIFSTPEIQNIWTSAGITLGVLSVLVIACGRTRPTKRPYITNKHITLNNAKINTKKTLDQHRKINVLLHDRSLSEYLIIHPKTLTILTTAWALCIASTIFILTTKPDSYYFFSTPILALVGVSLASGLPLKRKTATPNLSMFFIKPKSGSRKQFTQRLLRSSLIFLAISALPILSINFFITYNLDMSIPLSIKTTSLIALLLLLQWSLVWLITSKRYGDWSSLVATAISPLSALFTLSYFTQISTMLFIILATSVLALASWFTRISILEISKMDWA